jgi:hypothetical protein
MKRLFNTMGAAVLAGALLTAPAMAQTKNAPSGAIKLTQAQCTSLWSKIDSSRSGSVTQAAARPYVTDFKAIDSNSDGKLSRAEFMAGCNKGLVHDSASTGSGTGTMGSSVPKK